MKTFNLSVTFGLIIAVLLSFARFDALCDDLRDNVFRLHIKAASDSAEDQQLKMMVRDEILKVSEQYFENCSSKESAVEYAKQNIEFFKETAQRVIAENGYDYDVTVKIGDCYFENREYENFTLPAGTYQALNITIGEGKGKNWWCVMFPAVCIGASRKLDDAVSHDSARVAENPKSFKISFKAAEIYQFFKKLLGN